MKSQSHSIDRQHQSRDMKSSVLLFLSQLFTIGAAIPNERRSEPRDGSAHISTNTGFSTWYFELLPVQVFLYGTLTSA
ncbi:MAG: hypothetical protein U7126_01050 [Microcoleus sp.]